MNYTVQFQNISKKYQLGMTRTSIPTQVYEISRRILSRGAQNDASKKKILWAVKDVSFDLKPGESLALIGPNGAGKTTILKLLAQITKPTSGNIMLNGKLSALIELGAGFHPDLTGRENIYLNGVILGLTREEIRGLFDEIVAFAELEQFIDTPLKRYSSGMAVRLGFAVAATINPDILLVDEVLAVGDISFRLKCVKRIEDLKRNGTSLIFVSHNTGLIKAVCERSIYLEHGQIIYSGDTDQAINVYNRALNENRKKQLALESESDEETTYIGTIEVTKVKLTRLDNISDQNLKSSQPAKIQVEYVAFEDMKDIAIVLRIVRTDGVPCCVMYSRLDKVHFPIRRGNGVITMKLEPLQLYPGEYYVAATLKNTDESITYSLGRSEWLEVKGDLTGYEDRDAIFEPNRSWEHQII